MGKIYYTSKVLFIISIQSKYLLNILPIDHSTLFIEQLWIIEWNIYIFCSRHAFYIVKPEMITISF